MSTNPQIFRGHSLNFWMRPSRSRPHLTVLYVLISRTTAFAMLSSCKHGKELLNHTAFLLSTELKEREVGRRFSYVPSVLISQKNYECALWAAIFYCTSLIRRPVSPRKMKCGREAPVTLHFYCLLSSLL
jgi:hypothetical protein